MRDDLGDFSKPTQKIHIYSQIQPVPRYKYESTVDTTARHERNLEAIRRLKSHCESYIEEGSKINLTVSSRRFELWPPSNCYFSHAKNRFGVGIEELVGLIEKNLINSHA